MVNASELVSSSVAVACAGAECALEAPLTVPAHGVVELLLSA